MTKTRVHKVIEHHRGIAVRRVLNVVKIEEIF